MLDNENKSLTTIDNTKQKECDHLRLYSEQGLLSNPPAAIWTCVRCGKTGISSMENIAIYTKNITE